MKLYVAYRGVRKEKREVGELGERTVSVVVEEDEIINLQDETPAGETIEEIRRIIQNYKEIDKVIVENVIKLPLELEKNEDGNCYMYGVYRGVNEGMAQTCLDFRVAINNTVVDDEVLKEVIENVKKEANLKDLVLLNLKALPLV